VALYDRLVGTELPKLPVHQFFALAREVKRTRVTKANAANNFGLSASEKTEAGVLIDRITAGTLTENEVEDVLMLAEIGVLYTTPAAVKTRLGV
jgi:hypothetical protein